MRAVFLDRGTFCSNVHLPKPKLLTDWQVFEHTEQDNQTIIEHCQNADILITNKVNIDKTVISALEQLKLIQLTATGMNNVDNQACQDHNVKLYNVAGYAKKTVPEHTLMLMLMAMRASMHYHQQVIDGSWQQKDIFSLLDIPLLDLDGKTLGIIGVGNIGKRVSQLAKCFNMKVLWAEHQGKPARNCDYTAFDDVLACADIISLHCPLTPDTKHLINKDTIAKMQQRPLLINVARGDIVDNQAIINAIHNQQIFGYASDVFSQEPLAKDNPLLTIADHPRVIFTPHNAWGSISAQQRLWQILCKQVNEFIRQHQG